MPTKLKGQLNGKFNFSKMDYSIILGLLLLSVIPIIAGIFRVYQLKSGFDKSCSSMGKAFRVR